MAPKDDKFEKAVVNLLESGRAQGASKERLAIVNFLNANRQTLLASKIAQKEHHK